MYHDISFGIAVRFTLIFIAVIVPIQFVLALDDGARREQRHPRAHRLPLHLHPAARRLRPRRRASIWSSIFTEHGYLNTILQDLGLSATPYIWINPHHQTQLIVEVVVAEIWRSTALITVILIAGLQGIPKEYGEAAEVFGAGFFQRLRR